MTKHPTPDYWRGQRGPRGPRRFAFTYADYARLYGVSESTVKHWASTYKGRPRKLDPGDLQSIIAMWEKRGRRCG